jgi:beta-catenin-like protein 1
MLDDLGDEGLIDAEEAFYLQRLDGGLFTLQTVDYILAWVVLEDDGVYRSAELSIQSADES